MFKSPKLWKEIIGSSNRIESVNTWEMDCFSKAWDDWLAANNEFALGDRQYFGTVIKPYTCFVGIYISSSTVKTGELTQSLFFVFLYMPLALI